MSAAYIQNALQNTLTIEANSMNPDQTATLGAVWSWFIVFAVKATK